MYVLLKAIAACGVYGRVSILYDFLEVVSVYRCHLVARRVVLTVSLVEIDLGKESGTGSLCRASLVGLLHREDSIRLLKVTGYERPALVVGILMV